MTQSTQEREDSLLQALLQEYANASQLYMNTIAVTYTRFFGFLAVHGALIVSFFSRYCSCVAIANFNYRLPFSNFYISEY